MYASIQSTHFPECFCRVSAEPVMQHGQLRVYRMVGRNPGFNKWVSDRFVGRFVHVALDPQGLGYLFCVDARETARPLGPLTCRVDKT